MVKRWLYPAVVYAFSLLVISQFLLLQPAAWAQDEVAFTIQWGTPVNLDGSDTTYDLDEYWEYIWVQFYECDIDANSKVNLVAASKGVLDLTGVTDDTVVMLPKNKKFFIELIPVAHLDSQNGTPISSQYQRQFFNQERRIEDLTPGDVLDTSQPVYSWSFKMERGKKIKGKVTAPTGVSKSGIKVKVYEQKDGQKVLVPIYAVCIADGTYLIHGLSSGKYYVQADGAPRGLEPKFYPQEIDLTSDNEVIGINITLDQGKTITGTLLDPNGDPFQNYAEVYFVDTALRPLGRYYHDPNISSLTGNEAILNDMVQYILGGRDVAYSSYHADGSYSIKGIPDDVAENGILMALNPSGDYSITYYEDAYFLDKASPISLDTIEDNVFDLTFRPAGKIKGSIADTGGAGLERITVKAVDAKNEQRVVQLAYTDANGDYTIGGLPLIDYKILVLDEGYRKDADGSPLPKCLWQYYNNKFDFFRAETVRLTDENRITGPNGGHIDFVLQKGGIIRGQVRDADQQISLENIAISVYRLMGGGSNSLTNYPVATNASGIGVTDQEGLYEITGLPLGRYIIYARPQFGQNYIAAFYQNGSSITDADPNNNIVEYEQALSGRNFTLQGGGRIEGDITDIPEEAMDGLKGYIHVDLYDARTGYSMDSANEEIDPNTLHYVIEGIPQGEYKIGISDTRAPRKLLTKYYKESADNLVFSYEEASAFVIDPGSDTAMTINLRWDTMGAAITGEVMEEEDPNSPISLMRINAYKVDGDEVNVDNIRIYAYAYTNNDGIYSLTGLAEGTYILKAIDEMNHLYSPEYYSLNGNAFKREAASQVDVSFVSTPPSYDFYLNTYGTISGTITNDDEEKFENAWIYLYNTDVTPVLSQTRIADPNGYYSFTGLEAGNYKVRAFDPDKDLVARYYTSNSSTYAYNIEHGTELSLTYDNLPASASLTDIDICLNRPGGRIAGQVKSKDTNQPLSNVFIYLYQEVDGKWSLVWDYVCSDPNGRFESLGLPADTYKAMAWDYDGDYGLSYLGDPNLFMGNDVTLDPEGDVTIEFSLSKLDQASQADYALNLSEGMNIFCLPSRVPVYPALYNVNVLISDWAKVAGTGVKEILHFDEETVHWGGRSSAFLIENGKGYIAYSLTARQIKYQGPLHRADIEIHQGMNIVGNFYGATGYTSYQMISDLPSGTCSVRRYDPLKGKWRSSHTLWGRPSGALFPILPAEGYIVDKR
ncbi:MAG: MSCRAMM family protein [bacterium]